MPSAKRATASATITTNTVPPITQVKVLNKMSRVSLPTKISWKLSNPTHFLPLSSRKLTQIVRTAGTNRPANTRSTAGATKTNTCPRSRHAPGRNRVRAYSPRRKPRKIATRMITWPNA